MSENKRKKRIKKTPKLKKDKNATKIKKDKKPKQKKEEKQKKNKRMKPEDFGLKKDKNVKLFTVSNILNFILYASAILIFAWLHLLDTKFIILIGVLVVIAMPITFYSDMVYEHEKNRFYEYAKYLKYINVNYKITSKVDAALKDTKAVFEEGSVTYQLIDKAESMIAHGVRPDVALKVIEDYYDNSFIRLIHKFMVLGETTIGVLSHKALTQVNFQDWVTDAESFNIKKGQIKKRNNYFTVGALGLTWFTLDSMDMFTDVIAADPLYQVITFIYFAAMIGQYIAISQIVKTDWLKEL